MSLQLGAPIIIYLAGGMKNPWRDKVKARFPNAVFLDPTKHGLLDERQYTIWDLSAIARSEIVFGYMDADNPSGFELLFEMGYAFAHNKLMIFVNEKREMDPYCGMVRTVADGAYGNLDQGIDALEMLLTRFIPESFAQKALDVSKKDE
jgi:hypothetical protein